MNKPSDQELHDWNRWFAIECNNAAWDIAENPDRDSQAVESMLSTAIASAWHWQQVGTPVNIFRAYELLAWTHAIAGRSDGADHYTCSAQTLIDKPIAGLTDWDRAFHGLVVAMKHAATNDPVTANEFLQAADTLAPQLSQQDQQVFQTFRAAVMDKI